jgi:hypothetical protein
MKNRQKILPAVCCIALLSACASNRPVKEVLWSITPITTTSNVNNSSDAMYKMGRYYQGLIKKRWLLIMALWRLVMV